jgi:protein-S-isoprenylcysteine O-methyltransferase Ste14
MTATHGTLAGLFVTLSLGAVVVVQTAPLPGWLWAATALLAVGGGWLAVSQWRRYRAAARVLR